MNQHLLDELLAMKQRDADTRSQLVREGRLYDGYAEEMQQVHRENAHRLNGILSQHGWPTISLVGLEGCRAAWLIAHIPYALRICSVGFSRLSARLLKTARSQRRRLPF
jgi:hypothetical protein